MLIFSKNFFLLVFFLTLLFSCEKDVVILTINPIKLPEESDVFRIDDGCYESFFILDSFLIMTAQCDDYKIHIYNKNTLQLIKKFGSGGLAPSDLQHVFPLNNSSTTQKINSILYYDTDLFQFKRIDLEKILLGENVANCISSIPMDRALFHSRDFNILSKNQFVGRSSGKEAINGMFFIFDTLKKEKQWIEHMPKKWVDERTKIVLYYGQLQANSSKNSIVFASLFFDQVLFYDLNGNLQKQFIFSKLKLPELSNQFSGPVNESILYALTSYSSSEYCFIFRLGQQREEIIQIPPQLLVFSWDGLFLNAFELPLLPRYSIRYQILYDDEFGILYLLEQSVEENDPYIIVRKFKIDDFLNTM